MKAIKWIVGIAIAIPVLIIVISAIVPEKDCAGNNTYRTAEVCQTGK